MFGSKNRRIEQLEHALRQSDERRVELHHQIKRLEEHVAAQSSRLQRVRKALDDAPISDGPLARAMRR